MKKFFLLVIMATIVAFTNINAQSISVTVNSIDLKYGNIDVANWCPPGSIVSANALTRTITIKNNDITTFSAKLTSFAKIDNHYSFIGIASDRNIKNAKVFVDVYNSGKIKMKVVLLNGKTFRRTFSI